MDINYHAYSSVVESVGEQVQEVAVGDTVVPVFLAQCGECADCLSPRSNLCSALPYRPGMPRDGTTRFSLAASGEPVHNFLSVSSFAEYTVVDVAHVVRLGGDALPPEQACLLGCGVSTGTVLLSCRTDQLSGAQLVLMPTLRLFHALQGLVRLGRWRRWSPARRWPSSDWELSG